MKVKSQKKTKLNFKYKILNANNEFKMLIFSDEELKLEFDNSFNSDIKILNFSSNLNNSFERTTTGLSSRELECTKLLMRGKSNVEIAKKLSLSATTVSTYKKRVLQKTKTKNIVELTKLFSKEPNIFFKK
jgi:DNA-binding CsgD family transcriptional regulator